MRLPGAGQGTGLGLAVTDDARHDEVRVVERRAVRVRERVAELAALVDGSGRLRGGVGRDAARERELLEELPEPLGVRRDVRVQLAPGPLEPGVRVHRGATVPGPAHVEEVAVGLGDERVAVRVDEVQRGGGAPVPEQARLHVVRVDGTGEQRVVEEVDLPDGEVVRGAPPGVDRPDPVGARDVYGGHVSTLRSRGPEFPRNFVQSDRARAPNPLHQPGNTRSAHQPQVAGSPPLFGVCSARTQGIAPSATTEGTHSCASP